MKKIIATHSSSSESEQEEVDRAWMELAEERYLELESGAVKGVSWEEIKNSVSSVH
jgi:Putative addiction module component